MKKKINKIACNVLKYLAILIWGMVLGFSLGATFYFAFSQNWIATFGWGLLCLVIVAMTTVALTDDDLNPLRRKDE